MSAPDPALIFASRRRRRHRRRAPWRLTPLEFAVRLLFVLGLWGLVAMAALTLLTR